ncbi:MAG: hypothetical protein K5896_08435 [Prevotella sp.]|nr:hypothetical protein [Prevotella sp.]
MNIVNAPRRGNELPAQGIALGNGCPQSTPCKGKSIIGEVGLLPFQGEFTLVLVPRAMPWAECLLAFQAVSYYNC